MPRLQWRCEFEHTHGPSQCNGLFLTSKPQYARAIMFLAIYRCNHKLPKGVTLTDYSCATNRDQTCGDPPLICNFRHHKDHTNPLIFSNCPPKNKGKVQFPTFITMCIALVFVVKAKPKWKYYLSCWRNHFVVTIVSSINQELAYCFYYGSARYLFCISYYLY